MNKQLTLSTTILSLINCLNNYNNYPNKLVPLTCYYSEENYTYEIPQSNPYGIRTEGPSPELYLNIYDRELHIVSQLALTDETLKYITFNFSTKTDFNVSMEAE